MKFTAAALFLIPILVLGSGNSTSESETEAPACFDSYADSTATWTKEAVEFESGGVVLEGGFIYRPAGPGPHPAVVLMHGGGGNHEILRITPNFFARRFAQCGLVAITYDKRGTGDSDGDYASTTFDDFVADAGSAAEYLAGLPEVDAEKIGVIGFSQGGRLAPVVSVRYPVISYAVSVSGPFTPVGDTRLYAVRNSFAEAGVRDSVMSIVMPLWEEHFALLENRGAGTKEDLDKQIELSLESFHHSLLPPPFTAIPQMGIYNSMGRDYVTELKDLTVPWLLLYGEKDVVVPVQASIDIAKDRMNEAANEDYEVIVFPNAGHSFRDVDTGEDVGFEGPIFDWILKRVGLQQE